MQDQDVKDTLKELKDEIRRLKVHINIINEKLEHRNDVVLMRHEVTAKYKVSMGTLDKYIREGIVPARRLGGRVFLWKSDLDNIFKPAAQ